MMDYRKEQELRRIVDDIDFAENVRGDYRTHWTTPACLIVVAFAVVYFTIQLGRSL